ncbi:type II secretion system protein [Enterovibrio calviensis]|uniref:type II secretion system protein n=1 Tax=Enterovibrio calviensis TaxID=91359 RepID=UPI00048638E4|nr:type II secretion system protein [Enterovibrio calviensis]
MKRFKGLTLIEMIVSISVLGAITAVAVPVFSNQFDQARAEKLEHDILQLVDLTASRSVQRWKPTYIHLINIPSETATTDSSWCIVASTYSSVTECSDADDTAAETANEKRIATVWGDQHQNLQLKRLTSQTKFMFDNNSYSLFLDDDRQFDISFVEAQSGRNTFTAKVMHFKDFEFKEVVLEGDGS